MAWMRESEKAKAESLLVSMRSARLAPRNPPSADTAVSTSTRPQSGGGADSGPDGEGDGAGQCDDHERGAGGVLHGQHEGERQGGDD